MTKLVMNDKVKEELLTFLTSKRRVELIPAYLYYVSVSQDIQPVVYPVNKKIYQGEKEAISLLEEQGDLWRETEILIRFGEPDANAETKRIYICPFSGKAFGDNTHPNPQDAIYDWVSKCPENNELSDGLKVKRFFVSEDPGVIKNYITERQKPQKKIVYSSVPSGKLFNSKEAVSEDFKNNYLKPTTLVEVQNQNRFEIEENFLHFIEESLSEEKITSFIEGLAEDEQFLPHIERWLQTPEDAED
jgi:hypothetical protein